MGVAGTVNSGAYWECGTTPTFEGVPDEIPTDAVRVPAGSACGVRRGIRRGPQARRPV